MGYSLTILYVKSIDAWDPEQGASGRPRDIDEKSMSSSFENIKPNKTDIVHMLKEEFYLDFGEAHHDPETDGRFVITQVEDDDGTRDAKGRWLADYDLRVVIQKTTPVKVGPLGTPSL